MSAPDASAASAYQGCSIPPQVYEIAMGWDPRPEVERLLLLARDAGVRVASALELGCGAGRLLAALHHRVPQVCGIERSPAMGAVARRRLADVKPPPAEPRTAPGEPHSQPPGAPAAAGARRAQLVVGDMTDFAFDQSFDLIYASANTIRHAVDDAEIERMWRCIAAHLTPGGAVIADLELGLGHEQAQVGRPARWMLARGGALVHAEWAVVRPPSPRRPRSAIRWTFELREGADARRWIDAFELRSYETAEFLAAAARSGLTASSVYELRDPFLLPRDPRRFAGRALVRLQKPCRPAPANG